MLGVHDDVRRRVPTGFRAAGDVVLLLGATREEFGGSEWAHEVHGHLGGLPPAVDLAAEQRLADLLAEAARHGWVSGAHDLAEGGLAQALVESVLVGGHGATIELPGEHSRFVELFAETAARVVVTVPPDQLDTFRAHARTVGVPVADLGTVRGPGDPLEISGLAALPQPELRAAWEPTLPALFNR